MSDDGNTAHADRLIEKLEKIKAQRSMTPFPDYIRGQQDGMERAAEIAQDIGRTAFGDYIAASLRAEAAKLPEASINNGLMSMKARVEKAEVKTGEVVEEKRVAGESLVKALETVRDEMECSSVARLTRERDEARRERDGAREASEDFAKALVCIALGAKRPVEVAMAALKWSVLPDLPAEKDAR